MHSLFRWGVADIPKHFRGQTAQGEMDSLPVLQIGAEQQSESLFLPMIGGQN